MVMKNKALICALYVLINSQYASNANKLGNNTYLFILCFWKKSLMLTKIKIIYIIKYYHLK